MPAESTDFRRFDAVFALVGMLERSPRVDAWEVLFNDFFARARRQGVRYVEFTTGVNPTEGALRDLERLARRARSRYGIVVRVNTAFNRAAPPAENRESLRRLAGLLSRRRGSVIVGIDLLGPEAGHPALEAGQLLYGQVLGSRAWRGRFRRTFHAAGVGEIRNLRDALLLGAERVGHGSRWLEDSVSLELAAAQRTGVEVNLVSSVRLGYAPGYVEHPMLDLLRLGLRVSLSTDDEGIFATDLANEFEMAVTHTEITYHELKQLVYHSIGTAFVDDERKARMLRELDAELARFEAEWGLHAPGQAAPRAWSLFRLPETPRAAFRERG